MGRRRHSKHGQKGQQHRSKRRGGRSSSRQPLKRADGYGSDPEARRGGGGREQQRTATDSPLWNSLDEQSLAGLSPPPSLSALVAADYVYKSGLSSDEMEVTRKLSCLNFSVLPCAPDSLLNQPPTSIVCGQHQEGARGDAPSAGDTLRGGIHIADNMSDIEPYPSELHVVPATALLDDTLFPSASGDDKRPAEAMDCEQRRRRKRPSRKRPNRRAKKMRMHHHSEGPPTSTTTSALKSTVQPLSVNFIGGSFADTTTRDKNLVESQERLRRNRSFRRLKRQNRSENHDPTLCILSDTSAICEFDQEKGGGNGGGGGEMAQDDFFDCTPPAEGGALPIDMMIEGLGCIGGPSVSLEELPNESDLTETTTDSGCEGDDEESSVEGPSGRGQNLPSWWDKEDSSSSEDDGRFSQILTGTFPLMSKDGQSKFHHQLHNTLPEFKHPARFGILGKGGQKKRCKPINPSSSLTLNEISQKLINFVQNTTVTELEFGLVSRALCRTIANLAHVYNLECVIEQKRRLPVANPLLRKTLLTRLATRQEIEPILRNHGRESPTMLLKETSPRARGEAFQSRNSSSSRVNCGLKSSETVSVVGGAAEPLNETNVGNRILQGMGWSPGMGLGPNGMGIKDPVVAHVRPRHVGLGY